MKTIAVATTLGVASAARINRATTAPEGYTEMSGKCTGSWIENWSSGHSAHYGEDYQIDSLDDCADQCDEHPECGGFYAKEGTCSHWRSGELTATPQPGHTCYVRADVAAPASHHSHHSSGSCVDLEGYEVAPGKCTGSWIEMWSDGRHAHYGEDHQIADINDCADMCDEHNDCSGFYSKQGKCSHWRSGSLSVNTNPGHCCYIKSSSSLIQMEDEEDEDWRIRVGMGGMGWRRHRMGRHGMGWRRRMGIHINIR